MSSLNEANLIGHLGGDPIMRYTSTGKPVTNFSVACTDKWRDESGESHERTEWFSIILWNKLAEVANQYLHKGSKVYLKGRIQTRSWEKDGQKHYKTEIVASQLIMLDSKKQENGNGAPPVEDDDPF